MQFVKGCDAWLDENFLPKKYKIMQNQQSNLEKQLAFRKECEWYVRPDDVGIVGKWQ